MLEPFPAERHMSRIYHETSKSRVTSLVSIKSMNQNFCFKRINFNMPVII